MRRSTTWISSFHDEDSGQADPDEGGTDQAYEELDRIQVTGSRIAPEDVITNVQTPGVDEGGIVKRMGDVLIVLRGEHLYTVLLGDDQGETLRLAESYRLSEGDRKDSIWYDELLAFEGGLLVLSFDFDQHLTELHVFALSIAGELESRGRIQIQSDDYYSGSNYGMRLKDNNLLLSASVDLGSGSSSTWPMWRAHDDQDSSKWQPLIEPEEVLLPLQQNSGTFRKIQRGKFKTGIATALG